MWSFCLSTNASRTHLQMEQFSQSTGRTPSEDLGHWKGQERSPHNQVGQQKKEGKKRRGSSMGPVPLGGGAEEEERFLHLGKPPHQHGDQLGQKGNI